MEKPKEIYKSIESKIKEINAEIKLHQNINNEVAKNLYNSSNQIKDTLEGLQSEINNLEDNSEWEHYTISFIGETNAGKSTIIEALRIEYNEEEKRDNYDRNFTLLVEDRKSTRLNSSHVRISYAVFCLKKKKERLSKRPWAKRSSARPFTSKKSDLRSGSFQPASAESPAKTAAAWYLSVRPFSAGEKTLFSS